MELKLSNKVLGAIGLVAGLSLISPQIALANPPDNGDKDKVTICKKIKFFDKIVFKIEKEKDKKDGKDDYEDHSADYGFNKGDVFDIKVPDKLKELANLKDKVVWWFQTYQGKWVDKDKIRIISVDLAAVCVKSVTTDADKYKEDPGFDTESD
mgnify:CR=1 FL=1